MSGENSSLLGSGPGSRSQPLPSEPLPWAGTWPLC